MRSHPSVDVMGSQSSCARARAHFGATTAAALSAIIASPPPTNGVPSSLIHSHHFNTAGAAAELLANDFDFFVNGAHDHCWNGDCSL
jgi:hypothetical protein